MTVALEDPDLLAGASDTLRRQAGDYEDVGALLRGLRVDEWTGAAADGFRDRFAHEPGRWFDAADTLLSAAAALDAHADTVRWARGRLDDALELKHRADATPSPTAAAVMTAEAESIVAQLLAAVDGSTASVVARLAEAAGRAPRAPTWQTDDSWWDTAWRHVANAGVDVGNALLSTGSAIGHHPGDAAGLVAGAALLDFGASAFVASIGADLTGIGALVGVPAGAASAAVAVGGGALAAGSLHDLVMHATTDDAQTPLTKVPARPSDSEGQTADEGATAAPAPENWANPRTLARHFGSHGPDFGATSADDYAHMASEFFRSADARGLPTRVSERGTIRIYDASTNTFGSYTYDGMTKTFFKPTSPRYWARQPGVPR